MTAIESPIERRQLRRVAEEQSPPPLDKATLVLSQFIYRKGFEESQFGYASAAAVALFFMCIIVTIIQFFWNKRRSY